MRFTILKLSLMALVAVALVVSAAPANATTVTYNLVKISSGITGSGPYGTVTLTDVGSNLQVSINLVGTNGLIATGAGDNNTFLFDANGKSSVTYTLPAGWSGITTNQADGIHADGSGNWDFGVTCSGGACGSGGSSPAGSSLTFTINGINVSDLTLSSGGYLFAVDICVGTPGCSGGTGLVGNGTPVPSVPEPGSLTLLGTGLIGLAGLVRRRFLS